MNRATAWRRSPSLFTCSANLQPANNKATKRGGRQKEDRCLHNRLESGEDSRRSRRSSLTTLTLARTAVIWASCWSPAQSDPEIYDAISKLKPDQFHRCASRLRLGAQDCRLCIYKLISRDPAGQTGAERSARHQQSTSPPRWPEAIVPNCLS